MRIEYGGKNIPSFFDVYLVIVYCDGDCVDQKLMGSKNDFNKFGRGPVVDGKQLRLGSNCVRGPIGTGTNCVWGPIGMGTSGVWGLVATGTSCVWGPVATGISCIWGPIGMGTN